MSPRGKASIASVALALALALLALSAPVASAASGGYSATSSEAEAPPPAAPPVPPAETPPSGLPSPAPVVPGALAAMAGTRAIAPASAPPAVKAAIAAANRIRATPYVWGGGHGRWWDRGYDCSGSVSFMLHGAGLLEAPMVSGSFARWGEPGPGQWITIYANRAHVYAVVAGLRWDTGGDGTGETGPRWHAEPPYPKGFVVRHPTGY